MHRMLEQQLRQLIDTGEKVVDVWIRVGSSQPGVALIDSPSLLVSAKQRPHARLERLRIEAAQRGLRCSQIAAAAAVWRGAEGNGRLSAPVHSCNVKQAG